jgi:hypothetical protein
MNISSMSPQDVIKAIPTLIIGISTICFVLGLIIVNVHLSEYGIYSSELIRSEYMLAGAVYLALVAITTICLHYVVRFRKLKILWKRKRYVTAATRFLFTALIAVALITITLMVISLEQLRLNNPDLWFSILILVSVVLINTYQYKKITDESHKNRFRDGSIINKDGEAIKKIGIAVKSERYDPVGLVFVALLSFLLIALYALSTYKYIHTSFGGGNKDAVFLSPTARGLIVSKALLLPLNESETLVGPLEVLTESDKEIIILIPNEISGNKVAIRLNKELFDAVQAIPSRIEPLFSSKLINQ